ncbi:hypothetical protein B0J11DRAFT_569095 [Dendryphion nanum]|uniref:Uncharacterized protein n=1 Tax=Dendryphion nanum TaxID=256645 RepID=A0A9P9DNM9_9PLEO|nr:hypothetical protein B0J11DRAFT_569095 [Dendryphion nanum]
MRWDGMGQDGAGPGLPPTPSRSAVVANVAGTGQARQASARQQILARVTPHCSAKTPSTLRAALLQQSDKRRAKHPRAGPFQGHVCRSSRRPGQAVEALFPPPAPGRQYKHSGQYMHAHVRYYTVLPVAPERGPASHSQPTREPQRSGIDTSRPRDERRMPRTGWVMTRPSQDSFGPRCSRLLEIWMAGPTPSPTAPRSQGGHRPPPCASSVQRTAGPALPTSREPIFAGFTQLAKEREGRKSTQTRAKRASDTTSQLQPSSDPRPSPGPPLLFLLSRPFWKHFWPLCAITVFTPGLVHHAVCRDRTSRTATRSYPTKESRMCSHRI